MKYLVTGGLGVIGSHIAHKLINLGHEVVILDSAGERRNEWISGNFLRKTRIVVQRVESGNFSGMESIDAVIHCAASTGIPYSVTEPEDDWKRNVEGTRVLLEMIKFTGKRIPTVVLSSVKPYRVPVFEGRDGLNENDRLEPDEPYAASKAAQSMLCMAYARSYDMPIVTFRCSNLYGPAPCHGPRHGWLTWFCISAAIGRDIYVQGTGEQSRDMLHADDVFSACTAALENADALKGEVFNLGGGMENLITVKGAADTLYELAGGKFNIFNTPARAMDDDRVFVNYGKFFTAVGWKPKVGVMNGLRSVFEWATANADVLKKIYEHIK